MNGIVFGMFGIIIWFCEKNVINDDYPFEVHCLIPLILFLITMLEYINFNIELTRNANKLLVCDYKEKLDVADGNNCKRYSSDGQILTCNHEMAI